MRSGPTLARPWLRCGALIAAALFALGCAQAADQSQRVVGVNKKRDATLYKPAAGQHPPADLHRARKVHLITPFETDSP